MQNLIKQFLVKKSARNSLALATVMMSTVVGLPWVE